MQLSSLDDCIQDAFFTRGKLTMQINAVLNRRKRRESGKDHVRTVDGAHDSIPNGGSSREQGSESLALIRRYQAAEKRQLGQRMKLRAGLVESLRSRREAMTQGRRLQRAGEQELKRAQAERQAEATQLQKCDQRLRSQRQRLSEDLMRIYPVEPVRGS